MLARLAEAGGLELRIFQRDGPKFSNAPKADPAESPNADIVNEFLNEEDGHTFQSVPVAIFLTRDFRVIYRYVEFPAIYHKDDVVGRIRAARSGETPEQTRERGDREFLALQQSPFFKVWACAGVDEMISALHRLT